MTEDDQDSIRQAEMDEYWAEFDWRALDVYVGLLAWVVRQRHAPVDPLPPENWPGLWILEYAELRKLALMDPIINSLARHQLALWLCDANLDQLRPPAPDPFFEIGEEHDVLSDFAAKILLSPVPTGNGKRKGSPAIERLVFLIYQELDDRPDPWGIGEKVMTQGRHSASKIATALADRLSAHPFCATLPETAMPTAESIRHILSRKNGFYRLGSKKPDS